MGKINDQTKMNLENIQVLVLEMQSLNLMGCAMNVQLRRRSNTIKVKRKNKCHQDAIIVSKEEANDDLESRRINDILLVPEVNLMSHEQGILMPGVFDLM